MRSGYTDDCENVALYRNSVALAIRGKRGQAMLRKMADAMDAMPVKELITGDLRNEDGCCAIGTICPNPPGWDSMTMDQKYGHDVSEDHEYVSSVLNIAPCLAAEVMFINDEAGPYKETPAKRWSRVRKWIEWQLKDTSRPESITP